MANQCPKCGYYDYEDGWCGACGFGTTFQGHCERCGKKATIEEIPMMGYSLYLCRSCAAAAYRSEEAV